VQSAQDHPEQLAADDRAAKLQKDALRRLDQLLDALKSEKGLGRAQSQQGGGGGGGGQGGGQRGNPDDIPDIAQLKVLRSLQQEINERTETFGKQHPNPAKLSDGEKRELDSLSKEQKELSELLDEVTKPSDSEQDDESRSRNPKPEMRKSKPEIQNPKSGTQNQTLNFGFMISDFRFGISAQGPDAPRSGDQPEPPVRLKKKAKPAEASDQDKEKKPESSKKEIKPKEDEKEDEPAPAEPEQDPKEIVGRISKNMENSKERLAQKDPGDGTQQVQRDIVADLDKLIEQSQRQQQQQQQQQSSQSSSSRQQRQQASQRRRSGQQNRQASSQKSGQPNQPNQNNGQNPGAGGAGGKKNMSANADLYKDVWGHLPETLRKEMDAYSRVEFMSKYNDLLQQYYKRISEKGRAKSNE
jgi:hypothetical protein